MTRPTAFLFNLHQKSRKKIQEKYIKIPKKRSSHGDAHEHNYFYSCNQIKGLVLNNTNQINFPFLVIPVRTFMKEFVQAKLHTKTI
jgi:hypothetical protein